MPQKMYKVQSKKDLTTYFELADPIMKAKLTSNPLRPMNIALVSTPVTVKITKKATV